MSSVVVRRSVFIRIFMYRAILFITKLPLVYRELKSLCFSFVVDSISSDVYTKALLHPIVQRSIKFRISKLPVTPSRVADIGAKVFIVLSVPGVHITAANHNF